MESQRDGSDLGLDSRNLVQSLSQRFRQKLHDVFRLNLLVHALIASRIFQHCYAEGTGAGDDVWILVRRGLRLRRLRSRGVRAPHVGAR